MGTGTVVLAPAEENISSLPARHIHTGTEMQKEPIGTHWMALQVHSSRHLREVWQILGLHQGAGMIVILQWLVKHPSVRQKLTGRNGWQLSEEFCLGYTPQIGIRTRVPRKARTTNSSKKQSTKSTRAFLRNAKYPNMANRMANKERH